MNYIIHCALTFACIILVVSNGLLSIVLVFVQNFTLSSTTLDHILQCHIQQHHGLVMTSVLLPFCLGSAKEIEPGLLLEDSGSIDSAIFFLGLGLGKISTDGVVHAGKPRCSCML